MGLRMGRRLAVAPAAKILVSTGPQVPMELGHMAPEGDINRWFVHVWDLAKPGKSRVLQSQVPEGFAVSPDGNWLVTSEGRKIDLAADKEERLEGMGDVTRVCFSPDGKSFLALAGPQENGTIRVFDWPTMKLRVQLPDQFGYMFAHAFSDDSRRVALVDKERRIRLWDVNTGAILMVSDKAHSNSVRSLAISPDGKSIVSSGPKDEIWTWDAVTGIFLSVLTGEQQYGLPPEMECLAFSANGRYLVGGGPQNLILWNAANGKVLKQFDSSSGGASAAWFTLDQTEIVTIRGFHGNRTQAGVDLDAYPSMQTWTIPKKN